MIEAVSGFEIIIEVVGSLGVGKVTDFLTQDGPVVHEFIFIFRQLAKHGPVDQNADEMKERQFLSRIVKTEKMTAHKAFLRDFVLIATSVFDETKHE